jgi:exodeoxyribonuclease VII small subunit
MEAFEREPTQAATETATVSDSPESYEAAVERLEEIIDRLDSGQSGLRETLDLCREGRELVKYCAAELDEVGEGLKELRLDDLAARLEAGPEQN